MIHLLKRLLGTQKWIIAFMSLVLFLSALMLILTGSFNLVTNCITIYKQLNSPHQLDMNLIITDFLHIIDTYFLAIFFYIFSVGIFQLFIVSHELALWLHIKTIEDLKEKLAAMIVLVLATLFAQQVALWENSLNLLYSGLGITAICAVLIWFSHMLHTKK